MRKLIIILMFFITSTFFSQTPGGVGSANLSLWYRGDDTSITETSGAFNWPDGSGNNYDAYQNTSGEEPVQTNLFNFNESYTFDGTEDFLAITNLNYAKDELIKNLYGFVVYSSDYTSASTIDNHAFVGFSRNHGYSMALTGEGRLSFRFRDVANNTNDELAGSSTSNPNDGSPHIATYMFETANLLDTQIRLDGRVDAASGLLDSDLQIRTQRFGYIGDGSNSNAENNGNNFGNFFEGDIAEIILYNQATAMSTTDLAKIETHLALRYGITLDTTDGGTAGNYIDSNNNTIWDASANSTYHNAVGGIINDETTGAVHQKISKPLNSYLTVTTGITSGTVQDFTSENNNVSRTSVNTDTYLMFGENGASFGFEECGVAGKIILNKKWLFKESTTEANNVFIAVSEDLFPSGSTVQMIVSSDDTFDGSDAIVTLTNSGGLYYNSAIVDIDNDDRVSFLIDEVKIAGVSLGKIDLHIKADESNIVDGKLTLTDMSLGLSDAVENQTDNRPGTSDLMNFNPTLTFDGVDDYLYIKNKHYTSGDEIPNLHTFTVFSTDYDDGRKRTNTAFIDFDPDGVFSSYIRGDGQLVSKHRSVNNKTQTGVALLNDDLPHISETIFNGDVVGDDTFVKYDGVIDTSSEKEAGNIVVDKNRYGIIGDESNDDEENGTTRGVNYQGKISEIILADRQSFTTNEAIQIESYLALKYGITLDSSISNYLNSQGAVIWDDTNIEYWNGIAGIIKDDDDSDLDQRIAQSSSAKDIIVSTLSISAPGTPLLTTSNLDTDRTALNEGSYLLFGNNGKLAGGIEENVALSTSVTTRHWLFKESGTNLNDNVIVAIPKSYFPEGSTSVVAYISADDTFDLSDTSVALTDDGTYYYFSRDIDDGQYLAYALTPPTISGPGNVSNGLTMWIKANENVTSSGGLLTSIVDATLSGNNVLQSNNTEKPTINLNETNYNPTISFDTQHLAIEQLNYNGVGVIEKIYAWVIYKTDFFSENTNSGVDDKNTSFIDFDRTKYFNMHVRGDGKLSMSFKNSINTGSGTTNAIGSTITNTGTTQLGGFIFDNTLTNESILRLNGSIDSEDDLTVEPIGVNGTDSEIRYGYIGDGSEATTFNGGNKGDYYDGAISEIIFYEGETLDADEINRIESYLAIKYGVTLNGNYVDSTTPTANIIWDTTTNSGYNNDITVIGRDDDSDLYQKQSKSENSDGILTISIGASVATSNQENDGILDNLDFLAWGNNSTEDNFNVDCGASTLRVNKTWKVQNTGSVGAVTMQFDMSNIPDPASYQLIVDTDGNFTTTVDQTTVGGSVTDSNLTFTSVTLNDGVYFSLFKSSASDIVYNGSWSGGSGAGGVPDETDLGKRVTIENSVTLTESFKCNCLDIDAGQTVTVPTGNFINANEIVLNGDIYLEGTAELIQIADNTSNSGAGQLYKIVDEATSSQYRYNFFSSPVNTSGTFTIAGNLKFNTGADLSINTDPTFTTDPDGSGTTLSSEWFYDINNTTGFSRITENTALATGVGFTMKGTGTTNKYNFIGSPNNGEITVPLDKDNYLLTGNPYPSSINIDTFSANMLEENITDGTVYLWDQPSGDAHASGPADNIGGYATRINGVGTLAVTVDDNAITGAEVPEEFIKPGQGFVVTGADDGSSIKFTNALRDGIDYATEASTAHFYRTIQQPTSLDSRSIIRLGFEYKNESGNTFHRQLATVLENQNLLEREPGKDAYMIDNYGNDAYWILPEDDHRFVITGVPSLSDNENLELPIGVSVDQNREVTFKLDDVQNIDRYIYLVDNELGYMTNIKNNEYKILVTEGDYTDRFSLVFREYEENIILNLPDNHIESVNDKLFVYSNDKNLKILKGESDILEVKLYDFTGKELIKFHNSSKLSIININTESINSRLVIVRIITNNKIFTQRVIINN